MQPKTKKLSPADKFKSARISWKGWSGRVCRKLPGTGSLTVEQWKQSLSDIEDLLKNPIFNLKVDSSTTVAVYELKIAEKVIKIVIKIHTLKPGLKNFLRDLLRNKSLRNFKKAAQLYQNRIPTAYPIAAITKKNWLIPSKSIFITEYIDQSTDLYTFLAERIPQNPASDIQSHQIKQQTASGIANILSRLHKAKLWHRDAKAGNFLVTKQDTDDLRILLIDMDGIKKYFFATAKRRYMAFVKLGSILMWHKGINLTDYLRSFNIYCNLTKLDDNKRRKLFVRLSRSAISLRLLKFAVSAINKR